MELFCITYWLSLVLFYYILTCSCLCTILCWNIVALVSPVFQILFLWKSAIRNLKLRKLFRNFWNYKSPKLKKLLEPRVEFFCNTIPVLVFRLLLEQRILIAKKKNETTSEKWKRILTVSFSVFSKSDIKFRYWGIFILVSGIFSS